jgi:hypothetical protein
MDMIVDFPGGARVDAHFGLYTIHTDQPTHAGGDASAPTPFATFLAALGTCAGFYVLGFCRGAASAPTDCAWFNMWRPRRIRAWCEWRGSISSCQPISRSSIAQR